MSKIIHAIFESHWDGNSIIATPCEVNLDTKEVFNIERVDCSECCDHLDSEDVIFDGEIHKVVPQDEYKPEQDTYYYKW